MQWRVVGLLLVGMLFGAGLVTLTGSATPPATPPAAANTPSPVPGPSGPSTVEASAAPPAGARPADAAVDTTSFPAPAGTPTAPPLPTALIDTLHDVLASPHVAVDGNLGVSIVDAHGRPLVDHHASQALTPASTQKLLTAAAALHLLGADYRYTTRVYATAAPGRNGVLDGNLVVVGGGDPALASPGYHKFVYPARPRTPLDDLADRIADTGIRRVGRVVGDPSFLADQPRARGWLDRYFSQLDATFASGLTVDAGRRLRYRQEVLLGDVAGDPAQTTAAVLTELLEERGVEVLRPPIALRDAKPLAVEVARVHSPPLSELLRHTVQRSDNHMADGIFRSLGAVTGQPTWTGAARAARAALEAEGVTWDGARVLDGSGLSRSNRLSPALLTSLDRAMASSAFAAQWAELMAVAGETGTLRQRLAGTPAEGRLRGKTGTLRDVRALAASLPGRDHRRYHLAVVGNDLDGADIVAVRRLTDVLAMTLAADLYGCEQPVFIPPTPEPTSTEATPGPPPPESLVCPAA